MTSKKATGDDADLSTTDPSTPAPVDPTQTSDQTESAAAGTDDGLAASEPAPAEPPQKKTPRKRSTSRAKKTATSEAAADAAAESAPSDAAPKKATRKRSTKKDAAAAEPGSTEPSPKKTTRKRSPKKTTTVTADPAEQSDQTKAGTHGAEIKTPRSRSRSRPAFEIAGNRVTAGKRMRMEVPIGNLMSGTPVALPLIVVHGKKDGPVVWLSAAIHGDEIGGVEIIRQVLDAINARTMAGTIIAAPVVNVHGFNTNDRYLPDRRDLNRSFPGSQRGSLASRIAYLFMNHVVKPADVGIDLHTGSDLRTNLPQLRCDIDHGPTVELADIFGAPIIIDARLRDGSLRQASVEAGKVMLLFEGGEASRFDPAAIAAGVAGVLRILNHLGLTEVEVPVAQRSLYSRSTSWSRASNSGIVHLDALLGELVIAKQQLATIYDPFGKALGKIKAKHDGIVIGHTQAPLVNRGDALSHVAKILPDAPRPGWDKPGAVDDEDG